MGAMKTSEVYGMREYSKWSLGHINHLQGEGDEMGMYEKTGKGEVVPIWDYGYQKKMIMIYLFHKTSNITRKKKYQDLVVIMKETSKTLISSVAQLCPTLCDPMDCSTPGIPVLHQPPELAQTHIHRVSDAIQLSHPLLSPSLPAFNLSQPQGLFQWVSSSHQVAGLLFEII